MERKK